MIKIVPELKNELVGRGKWPDFIAACERMEREGLRPSQIRDDAIDEVCPDLVKFKRRKKVKMCEVKAARTRPFNDSQCNGYRMLEWVVERFEDPEVMAYDAPSAVAWSILCAAKRDEDTYRDVLKKYLDAKLKVDAAQGDTDTRKMDGQREYDILDGLDLEVEG